ncbi:LAME_0F08438g1_1 [Lachancea meyersii CBS 8951]|uniref:LAME_0F08438g1_1 n=1 Tax=Lachancea meyersii CBS 8951 TaxID=1266667 RepID=A0A1G4JUL3_9SACH|nr:LAME_0F08438g1_1 [Lachancea meyersii CBS 8951]
MELKLGDRLCIDRQFCTVRYIGKVPQWNDLTACGLEWDDEARGKHSGTVGGVKYFETESPNGGSLVKESKVMRASVDRKSFSEALSLVYLSELQANPAVYFGCKKVEMLGLDTLSTKNQDIEHLKVVNLSNRGITQAGEERELDGTTGKLKNLKDLDLSFNLFTDFTEVLNIVRGIPSLRTLNISGNRFSAFNPGVEKISSVEELIANNCEMAGVPVEKLCSLFPKLKKLSLNEVRGFDIERVEGLSSKLTELSIAQNGLQSLPANILASSIEKLNLSSNPISELLLDERTTIKELNLSHCGFKSWKMVDDLCEKLPSLKNLKITHNPIMRQDKDDHAIDASLQVIGRMRGLEWLNGTSIDEKERSDAELYVMALVAKGQALIDENGQQWQYLIKKHGMVRRSSKAPNSIPGVEVVVLDVILEKNKVQEVSVLPCYSARYLKSIISKIVSMSIFDFELNYTSKDDGIIHEFNFEFSPIGICNLKDHDIIHVVKTNG